LLQATLRDMRRRVLLRPLCAHPRGGRCWVWRRRRHTHFYRRAKRTPAIAGLLTHACTEENQLAGLGVWHIKREWGTASRAIPQRSVVLRKNVCLALERESDWRLCTCVRLQLDDIAAPGCPRHCHSGRLCKRGSEHRDWHRCGRNGAASEGRVRAGAKSIAVTHAKQICCLRGQAICLRQSESNMEAFLPDRTMSSNS
jgi:hypothetical protein